MTTPSSPTSRARSRRSSGSITLSGEYLDVCRWWSNFGIDPSSNPRWGGIASSGAIPPDDEFRAGLVDPEVTRLSEPPAEDDQPRTGRPLVAGAVDMAEEG